MKNFDHTTRTALRLAATASLALVAMVSSAHAQGTMTTHTVELHTGYDSSNQDTLSVGDDDGGVTYTLVGTGGTAPDILGPLDFFYAEYNYNDAVLVDETIWNTSLTPDVEANWIHFNVNTALDFNALYAQTFELPAEMPSWASITMEIDFRADDRLQGLYFRSDELGNPATEVMGLPQGDHSFVTSSTVTMSAADFGLAAGKNTMFFHQHSTSSSARAGIRYSVTLSVSYCAVTRDLRSGIGYDSDAQSWVWQLPGSPDLDLLAQVLPDTHTVADFNSAFSLLSNDIGTNPEILGGPGSYTALSEPAGWVNFSSTSGYGNPDNCVLYSHKFNLPSLNATDVVSLELEWAADDEIGGYPSHGSPGAVFINTTTPLPVNPGPDVTGGFSGGSYSDPKTATIVSTVADLGLVPGVNRLYLLQEDVHNSYSGIIYIAKLSIATPCEGTPYESFCDCLGDLAPCGNQGSSIDEGCSNSTGKGSGIKPLGEAKLSANTLRLEVDNLPNNSVGLFFEGINVIGPIPFGDGLRCVGGQLRRIKIAFEDGTGHANSGLVPLPIPANPGMKFYQFWYRDSPSSQSPCQTGFNFSNAVGIPWVN